MSAETILYVIIAFVVIEFLLDKLLDYNNAKSWESALPDIVSDLYDNEKYEQAKSYAKANAKLSLVSGIINFAVIILMLALQGFAYVNQLAVNITENTVLQTLIFFAVLISASSIINLPFNIYKTFVIEEQFGFNKTNVKTFTLDLIKGLVLGAIIGGLLLGLLTWLYYEQPTRFWWLAWLVMTAFSLFFATFYTTLILPLFNKLEPLPDGTLRDEIETYSKKVSFPLSNILIIDGSKRSSKANAFFSGLGKKKAIVLYDTLIKDNSNEELTAILAHEVGHYKKNHIQQSMVLGIIQTGMLFFIFSLLAKNENLAHAFSIEQHSFHIALIGFSILYTPISLIIGILMNMFSRKNEFEADNYAKETYGATPLISSLKKLSVSHLSNLTPNKWYVFVHFSHPPLVERLRALHKN